MNAEAGFHRKPRKTSDARGGFPYADSRVPLIMVYGSEEIDTEGAGMNWAHDLDQKIALVEAAKDSTAEIIAVWPGKTRSDVFILDDLDEAQAALVAA